MKAYWHIHHDRLLELSDDIGERIKFIKAKKPKRQIELRLRLLKPVRGKLPGPVVRTIKAYDKACKKTQEAYTTFIQVSGTCHEVRKTYQDAWLARGKAERVFNEAVMAHRVEIEALHKRECPNCPWDGTTIFPQC